MSTIVTRASKGSALTWTEGDANITNLNNDKMENFTVAGDSGSNQTISGGNTLTISGGTNLNSVASSTDTITINLDSSVSGLTSVGSTAFSGTNFDASGSAGGHLRNSSGVDQLDWGAGGGSNLSLLVATNINPANASVSIAPTGTGSLTINPATAGNINNMAIGGTTAAAGRFTTLTATGTTTLATALSGVLKASSGVVSAATAGTDFVAPSGALGTPSSGNLSNCTADGTNGVGFRSIPSAGSEKTGSYSLQTSDRAEFVQVGSGGSIIVPNSTFAAGDVVVIYNNHTAAITITLNTTNAYIAGTNTNKTSASLATRGVCNILFISSTVAILTGNVS
jgi:hypothetical protein